MYWAFHQTFALITVYVNAVLMMMFVEITINHQYFESSCRDSLFGRESRAHRRNERIYLFCFSWFIDVCAVRMCESGRTEGFMSAQCNNAQIRNTIVAYRISDRRAHAYAYREEFIANVKIATHCNQIHLHSCQLAMKANFVTQSLRFVTYIGHWLVATADRGHSLAIFIFNWQFWVSKRSHCNELGAWFFSAVAILNSKRKSPRKKLHLLCLCTICRFFDESKRNFPYKLLDRFDQDRVKSRNT